MMIRPLIGCLLAFSVALPGIVQAQEKLTESQWKRGLHGFNLICDAAGLTQVSKSEFKALPTKEKVLVIFGDLNLGLDIDQFLEAGGAVLAASDQQGVKSFSLRAGGLVRFTGSKVRASFRQDMLDSMSDCPIIRDVRQHPALDSVETIVANRPGILITPRKSTIAFLPPILNQRSSNAFIASVENSAGGRLMAVADQSIFTNQMIADEDNDLFAYQTMLWLKDENRKHFLVISDGWVQPRLDPADVELSIPPPSREEVLDALKNLPPSAMLRFGNSVATVVEDQNMVNEFIHDNMDQMSDVRMNRLLIFLFFGLICLACVAAFVLQKKLLRQTASVVASQRNRRERKRRKSQEAHERQWAAGVLLDSICIELADRRYNDWPGFPQGLGLENDTKSRLIFRSMAKASNLFKSKPKSYWDRKRLRELDQDLFAWREFFQKRNSNVVENDVGEVIEARSVDQT